MKFKVTIRKKAQKGIEKAPILVQKRFFTLIRDLQRLGPYQPHWPNYSPLGEVTYHCHLNYSWVAC